ncbi:MAG: hypothetical protein HQM16_01145 [Deltaproteobacteria bacterium]|nr:hypothetical protein [Deltaproteobacteria bacterium]
MLLSPGTLLRLPPAAQAARALPPALDSVAPHELLGAVAWHATDNDPRVVREILSQGQYPALPQGDETTRAGLRAYVAEHPPRSFMQRVTQSLRQWPAAIRQLPFLESRWPLVSMGAGGIMGTAVQLMEGTNSGAGGGLGQTALCASAGLLAGAVFGAASSMGTQIFDRVCYLLFCSRKFESFNQYRESVSTLDLSDNYSAARTTLGAAGFGLGGGMALYALHGMTGLLGSPPTAGAVMTSLAIATGAMALRYINIPALPFIDLMRLSAENTKDKAIAALLAEANTITDNEILTRDLSIPLQALEHLLEGRIKEEIDTVLAEIGRVDQTIDSLESLYDGLTQQAPEDDAALKKDIADLRHEELSSYQAQRQRLNDEVLKKLLDARRLAKALVEHLNIELGRKIAPVAAEAGEEQVLGVMEQLALRKLAMKRSEGVVNRMAARAQVFVDSLKQVLDNISKAERVHTEMRLLERGQ